MNAAFAKLLATFYGLFGKFADAAAPAKPLEVEAEIVEIDNAVYAAIRVGGYYAKERLDRDIYKWPEDRQAAKLEEVKNRLLKKLKFRELGTSDRRELNRKERRARGWADKRGIKVTRIKTR